MGGILQKICGARQSHCERLPSPIYRQRPLFSARCPPKMEHVAKIANTTPKVPKAEKWAIQRTTYIPHNITLKDMFFFQHGIAMRKISPLHLSSQAAMLRITKLTCSWKPEWANLQKTKNERLQ